MLDRIRRSPRPRLVIALIACLIACGPAPPPTFQSETDKPVCLVLSVGAQDGLAHLGAIRAIQESTDLEISFVTGSSMGALVGSLYATDPSRDPVERYEELMARYLKATKQEAGSGSLLLGLVGLATGGLAWAAAGATLGATSINKLSHGRFVSTLDNYYEQTEIDQLPIS